jgi:hypothetical protein
VVDQRVHPRRGYQCRQALEVAGHHASGPIGGRVDLVTQGSLRGLQRLAFRIFSTRRSVATIAP